MIFQNNTNDKTMKKIKSIIIITIALCTISCASCSKDSKKTSSAGKNFLSFKIDGVLWESKADKVFGSYHFNESLGNKLLQISGSKGDAPNDQTHKKRRQRKNRSSRERERFIGKERRRR